VALIASRWNEALAKFREHLSYMTLGIRTFINDAAFATRSRRSTPRTTQR